MTEGTVGQGLSDWLALHTLGRKPSSQKFNREVVAMVQRNWPGPLNVSCSQVRIVDVTGCVAGFAHYCPSRWNAAVSALQFALPLPAAGLDRRELRSKDRTMLTRPQFRRLLVECDRLKVSRAGVVVRFLAHTGMRITEAKGLRWEDVQRDHVLVPGRLTKNGKPRAIPFVKGTRAVVAELRGLAGEWVLPRPRVRRGLGRACERAGLPRLSHSDFRHLFATRCIESGVDLPTVARWLGHGDKGATLAKRYFHLLDEHSRRMSKRVRV